MVDSDIGRIAIPLLLGYYAGPLAGKLGLGTGLGAKALVVGGGTGLSSLIAGDDPEEAFKKGVISGGLYYGGGKLFGPKAGVDKTLTPDKTVKDIRKKATGQTKQQKEIDGLAALNRMRRSVS